MSSFVYSRRLPFHAKRFNDWLEQMPQNIVRSKVLYGLRNITKLHVYCHKQDHHVISAQLHIGLHRCLKKTEGILAQRRDVAESWDIEYGDRNTQFVIIGTDLDQEK